METHMDLFDQYIRGELSRVERENFERRLESDTEFRREFEQHKNAIRAIEFAAIKEKISKVSVEAQRSKMIGRKGLIAIAASIALLIGAYVYTINTVEPAANYENAFASIHFKDPGLPTLMGHESLSQEMNTMMTAYKQSKYQSALEMGEALLEKYPESDTLQYYLAMIHYEMGYHDKAEDLLTALESRATPIGQKSEWYLYLIDLKRGDCQAAMSGIKSIAKDKSHIFRIEAMDALDVLELTNCAQ